MFEILLQLLFVFLVIMFTKNIMDMKKYNSDSQLVELKEFHIEQNKRIMDPLLIDYSIDKEIDITEFKNKNPLKYYCNGDICLRLSDFDTIKDINIYNNNILIKDLNLKTTCDIIFERFENMYSFNTKYSCSLFKGENDIHIEKNKNNIFVLGCFYGECNVYLYNPKHIDYLNDKNRKKYSINIELKKDKLLYIPSEWYYNITTKNDCGLIHIKSDTYFTSLYNEYRD